MPVPGGVGAPGPHATDRRAAPSTVNAPAEAEQAGLGAFSPLPATKKNRRTGVDYLFGEQKKKKKKVNGQC